MPSRTVLLPVDSTSRQPDTNQRLVVPRWTDFGLPSYSYVPGLWPRPANHGTCTPWIAGTPNTTTFDPENWQACTAYLAGIDLFNAGYYWEAHEAWELVWIQAGRTTCAARFIQGLIKLAACGVKAREGVVEGVRRHARRSAELWDICKFAPAAGGLELEELRQASQWLLQNAEATVACDPVPVLAALPLRLWPRESAGFRVESP
ncbi:MAG: DUF309 domain-containing protein [Planctomycetota bacterium]|nr:DUF309 domain-containing protein [Planctomycetota bacterium]MDA1177829.1 DUF309 domain-containing protein [Planctomycetota bacterium]